MLLGKTNGAFQQVALALPLRPPDTGLPVCPYHGFTDALKQRPVLARNEIGKVIALAQLQGKR